MMNDQGATVNRRRLMRVTGGSAVALLELQFGGAFAHDRTPSAETHGTHWTYEGEVGPWECTRLVEFT